MRSFLKIAAAVALTLVALPACAATFTGEFWDATSPIENLAQAQSVIDTSSAPTATFQSSVINYPAGLTYGSISDSTTLSDFLGVDAPSLSGAGTTTLEYSVFRFSGWIDLTAGLHDFWVASDDGFALYINDIPIMEEPNTRGIAPTSTSFDAGAGLAAVTLLFFENVGNTGVHFKVDGALAAPATVPLPATLPLLAAALGAGALLRRRRKAT